MAVKLSKFLKYAHSFGDELLRNLWLVSLICFIGGLYFVVFLPTFPKIGIKRIYFSEHALQPGNANTHFDGDGAKNAVDLAEKMAALASSGAHPADAVVQALRSFGLEGDTVHYGEGDNSEKYALSVIESLRGDAREALLVHSHIPSAKRRQPMDADGFLSAAVAASLAKTLLHRQWLAKDVFFVFSVDEGIEERGSAAFLSDFFGEGSEKGSSVASRVLPFSRGAILRACSHIEIERGVLSKGLSHLEMQLFGADGRRPNLDLPNVLVTLSRGAELPIGLPFEMPTPHFLYRFVPTYLFPYLNFMFVMLRSTPTSALWRLLDANVDGVHIVFKAANEAIAMEQSAPSVPKGARAIYSIGTILEGFIRTQNNILERIHQSFWYYMIPQIGGYVSIGDYTLSAIPFLLPPALAILLPALLADSRKQKKDEEGLGSTASSLFVFSVVAIMNCVVLMEQLSDTMALSFAAAAVVVVFGFYRSLDWGGARPVCLLMLIASIAVLLLKNFPFGAAIAAFYCLFVPILAPRKAIALRVLQAVFCLLVSPLSLLLLSSVVPALSIDPLAFDASRMASPLDLYASVRSTSFTFSLWGPGHLLVVAQSAHLLAAAVSLKKAE